MLLLALLPTASATWSIVAADAATQQVGGAITSCVGTLDTVIVYGGVPGVGAVHAQAQLSTEGRDRAVERLGQGIAPEDILAEITAASFDSNADARQYGIVDLQGRAAGWTGGTNGDWAGDRQGQVGEITWSAQGNILTGQEVIDQAVATFEADGCDLAERLMSGLEAGALKGAGDSRCTDDGIGSDSAAIIVQAADGSDIVRLSVVDTSPDQAVDLLREQFQVWRADNACPEVDPGVEEEVDDTDEGCGCAAAGGPVGGLLVGLLTASLRRRRAR